MQRKVYLEGEIADRFGSEFDMDVSSFGEAMHCFELNFEGFREYLIECHEKGVGFVCSANGKELESEEELLLQYPKGSLTLQAVPAGSKSGFGKILAAIAIVAVMYFTGGFGTVAGGWASAGTAAGGGLTTLGTLAVGLAVNLALTGLQQLMAPDPSVDVGQDQSYLFQGAGQTILEGDPVPVLYGRLRVPGRPISFEIKNSERQFTDYAQASSDYINPYDPGGYPPGGGSPDTNKFTSQEGAFSAE